LPAVAAWFFSIASPIAAQTSATLGMTGSVVQYDGFLTSTAATVAPALRFDTPNFSLGGQGSWTLFESGSRILQATAAAAWLTPARERWRLELSGSAGASRYADEPASGHALARGRFHFFADDAGGWVGATTGASFDSLSRTPFELAIGGWSVRERLALVGTITTTWLGADRHLDVTGAARWTGRRFELETRLGVRPWVSSAGRVGDALTGLWCEVYALFPLNPHISLELGGGSYPSDPVRRVLGSKYATAGLRLDLARDRLPPLTIPAAIVAAVQRHNQTTGTPAARLEILPAGSLHIIRVHGANANSVDVMGDFTDWNALPLARRGDGIWETRLQLTAGVHRLNVRIDGGPWLVPAGVRPEEGEFGGVVGVVVVR
jgi:hypothetical protein